jgi:hypothetical protein
MSRNPKRRRSAVSVSEGQRLIAFDGALVHVEHRGPHGERVSEPVHVEFGNPLPEGVTKREECRLDVLGALGFAGQPATDLRAERESKIAAYRSARSGMPREVG